MSVFAKKLSVLGLTAFAGYGAYKLSQRKNRHPCWLLKKHDNPFQHFVGSCTAFVTPNAEDPKMFSLHNQKSKNPVVVSTFAQILSHHHIDWNSKIISIAYIPKKEMKTFSKFWNQYRSEPFEIQYKSYVYRLYKNDLNSNTPIKTVDSNDNIIYKPLGYCDVDKVMKLNKYPSSLDHYEYIRTIIGTKGNASLGAYDRETNELIGCALFHIDGDGSEFGGLAVAKKHRRHGIAFKLSQKAIESHFEQNPDSNYVIAQVAIDNHASLKFCDKIGFKRLNDTYYWIKSEKVNTRK